MGKYYSRINWKDDPNTATPLSAENLNKMDKALEQIDNEVLNITDDMEIIRNDSDKTMEELNLMSATKIDGAYADDEGYLYLTANGEVVAGPIGPFAGSSGGSTGSNNATLTVANTTGWISNTFSDTEPCRISFTWTSVESDLPTGNGSVNIRINGASKAVKNIKQGDVILDLKDYLGAGSNIVRLSISDVYGNTKILSYTINIIAFSLTSTFDDSEAYSGDITFPYVATGSVTKTMQFVLDGSVIGSTEVTNSGRQQNFNIPVQPHGSHTFEVYFTALVNEATVESNHLYYDIMFVETGNTTPIIASSFNATGMSQYYSVSIPYSVYTPNSMESEIELYANGELLQSLTVDRTKHNWTYRAYDVGDLVLEIRTGEITKQFNITVTETDIDVSAETNGLELYLTAYGRSNAEANPAVWEYGDISASFENFNFVSDGWQYDDDANSVLRVKGDARLTIPLNIFGSDFRRTGKTIEFEFATKDILDYETTVISCFANSKGIIYTPQKATFMSDQSSLSRQYKEDEHVRVSFVVEKSVENRLLLIYIDGILSGSIEYPESDDFQQANPVGITIGSNDCTIDLYSIRVYSNNLTRYQMLDNWIADTQNGYDMLTRYNHNNIYDEYGQIVISKLPSDLPYMVLECAVLPQYKGDKKTCSGYYVDPVNPSKSFRFEDAQIDVQGTSSQYYKRKNYKIKFKNGFIMESSGETLPLYQLRDTSIGVNTFTYKADVASCEGANNVELVRLWNDICPYKTPPQQSDPDVQQGIDGFPIVIFWSNGTDTMFLGKANFNHDKGTPEVFGFNEGDESWEILNNTSARSMFKSADFSGTAWLEDFEGRYPDGNEDPTNLASLAAWLVSTDQSQATGETLAQSVTYDGVEYKTDTAEYRLAKFKIEADYWLEMDSIVFSYIFTELFLLVDSRAKNNFPTKYVNGKWCVLPYDMDTAIGTNNEGLLVFDYNLEDTDTVNGANVYNGQDSVLYINTRDAFPDRIEEMYNQLRSEGKLSYEEVEKRFEEHQAVWPEAIFNEDAYYKYLDPLIEDGEGTYLSMCQGSKASQRKWWLFNRFRYIDSKYTSGNAKTSTITLRAYQKSDFNITPYADIYPAVSFDGTVVKKRGKRNEVCAIVSPEAWDPNGSDAVVTVYSANQLKDIGDISAFKVGYADFSKAVKLQRIKVGDSSIDYSNENLAELILGNNTLLKIVDARNCPNLATTVNLSGCTNIEEAYFDGTSVIGVQLPNGGILKTLHLPGTVKELTIRNQNLLTDFVLDSYSQLTSVWLENVGDTLDSLSIVKEMTAGSRLRIINFNWTFTDENELDNLIGVIDTMRGLDENGGNVENAQLKGTINIDTIGSKALYILNHKHPDVTAVYKTVKKYTVTLYNGDEVFQTVTDVNYGDDISALVEIPVHVEGADEYEFTGWSSDITFIEGDINVYAEYKFIGSVTRKLVQRTITEYSSSNITTIGTYAFNGCNNLTSINIPNVTTVKQNAFAGTGIVTAVLPNVITIELQAFMSSKIQKLDLPVIESLANSIFNYAPLETLIIRNPNQICVLGGGLSSTVSTKIYVPSSLLEEYKAATNWSVYADQIFAIEDYPDICG